MTIATGCPTYTTSSRASGSYWRPSPVATIGKSAAVSTPTTPGAASAASVRIAVILAWASWATTSRACNNP